MEIVAEQGDGRFLLVRTDEALDRPVSEPLPAGRIYDREAGELFPVLPVESILSRGYWNEWTASYEDAEILAAVEAAKST